MGCCILSGMNVIEIDGIYHEVKHLNEGDEPKPGIAYLIDDMLLPFWGSLEKMQKHQDDIPAGIYLDNDGKHHIVKPSEKNMYKYLSDRIENVNIENLINEIKDNPPDVPEYDMASTQNEFIPIINEDDDMFKKAIKLVFHELQIDLKVLKGRAKNDNEINNMRAGLLDNRKMSQKYFYRWCEILGLKAKMVLEDNGDQPN